MDKCSICMNNIDNNIDNIIYKCNDNRHFYCEDCMKHFLSTIRNDYNFINNYERNNQIKCYSCDSHFEHNILLNSSIKINKLKLYEYTYLIYNIYIYHKHSTMKVNLK